MSGDEQEQLLKLLNAHGQQFLSSFDSSILPSPQHDYPEPGPSNPRRKSRLTSVDDEMTESEGEWEGLGNVSSEEPGGEDINNALDSEIYREGPEVHVFSDSRTNGGTAAASTSRALQKSFMSSKVAKVTQELSRVQEKQPASDDDEDDDLTNAQNDALLHRLVHTKILSGSLNSELDLTPAQRRKALAGRVLEAAGKAKLGKGESFVRAKERNKAAKHVRDGLIARQKERNQKEREEAKHMGNYHPMFKQLYESGFEAKPQPKRERGLKMGVGQFTGGVLKLSRAEISSVTGGGPRDSSGGKRGRRR